METTRQFMDKYFKLLTEADWEKAIPQLFTEDFAFITPRAVFTGSDNMIKFMAATHPKGVKVIMRPHNIFTDGETAAVELVEEWHISENLPFTVVGSVKKGDVINFKIAAFYKLKGGKVAEATIYEFGMSRA